MGLFDRMKAAIGGLLAPAEDPRQATPSVYERHVELLRKLQAALAEVSASKQQLEAQTRRMREGLLQVEDQARNALRSGREDLARLALQRRRAASLEIERLEEQVAEVSAEEARLALAEQRLAAQIEAFRTRQEVISARYTAAEAQVRISEALAGISRELSDLSAGLEQAETRTERMQARASAIDQLMAAGVLPGGSGTTPEASFASIDEGYAVEADLEALRRELASPEPPTSPATDPSPDRSS